MTVPLCVFATPLFHPYQILHKYHLDIVSCVLYKHVNWVSYQIWPCVITISNICSLETISYSYQHEKVQAEFMANNETSGMQTFVCKTTLFIEYININTLNRYIPGKSEITGLFQFEEWFLFYQCTSITWHNYSIWVFQQTSKFQSRLAIKSHSKMSLLDVTLGDSYNFLNLHSLLPAKMVYDDPWQKVGARHRFQQIKKVDKG